MIFQVIDVRSNKIEPQVQVEAASPEDAARQALGIEVFRGGLRGDLVARVYWETAAGGRNMVRLYSRVVER